MISRRNLLVGSGVVAAAAALTRRRAWADDPLPPSVAWPEADFSRSPNPTLVTPDPAWGGPTKILEIFLVGGLSPFESFFCMPRTNPTYYGPAAQAAFAATALTAACDHTMASPRNGSSTRVLNAGAQRMEWSVGTAPLWDRLDILARTRVVAMTHGETTFAGHPTARPYALTGRRIGDPRAATLGAAMKRRYPGQHTSYVLTPASARFNSADFAAFDAWMATGNHGPAAQPVLVPMATDAPALATWAARSGVPGGAAASDTLAQYYASRYDRFLPHPPDGTAGAHRYRGFEAYRAALGSLHDSPQLTGVFGSSLRNAGPSTNACVAGTSPASASDTTKASFDMAAWLFQHMQSRYVGMYDVGIEQDTQSPYDGHSGSAVTTYGNLFRFLSHLADFIAPDRASRTATQMVLDDVLIILNTEFGRTPNTHGGTGRDHYGAGYVTLLIGGPVRPTPTMLPRLVGDFAPSRGTLEEPFRGLYTPANVAWGALVAAGIAPDHPDNFAVHEEPPDDPSSPNPAAAFFKAS